MSAAEILDELSRLDPEELHAVRCRAEELLAGSDPALLAAVDEAEGEPQTTDLSGEKVKAMIGTWAGSR